MFPGTSSKACSKYGNEVFDKSHFLIEDDSDVPSGTHRHYSFTGYLDGLDRRAWATSLSLE